ncbi:hypothetical protein [[Phormidium] sp. ETS-05]|uniref:hypothetical protein n=1 Tax=[Phormidium] sp. ETS-05 TaxID=222819 RepID=UPI0018EF0BC7|nr:hypothetical protein [[Phormidium] sp. ETS-05]
MEPKASATPIPLSQWINHNLNQKDTKITHRIRGNILHILCEARECPQWRQHHRK